MLKKKLSIIGSIALIGSYAFAGTIELKSGWNLISVPSLVSFNKTSINNLETISTYNGTAPVPAFAISKLVNGKGYWVKVSRDTNISIQDKNIGLPTLRAGWNLVGLPTMDKTNLKIQYENSGYKFDTISTYNGTAPVPAFAINNIDPYKAYWVKVEKLAAVATTRDGYDVKLYVDNETVNTDNLVSLIANYNLDDLPNIKNQVSSVSNLVLSTTKNGQEVESSYISPESLTSTIVNNFKQNLENPTANQTGAALYVYGMSEGGAPFIISDAKVYSVNADGSRGDYLGETSQTGYLFLDNLNNGDKVWVEKDGFLYSIQTVKSTSGNANYIFLSKTNVDMTNDSTSTSNSSNSNARVLNRVLYGWDPITTSDGVGHGYFIPENIRYKRGTNLILVPVNSITPLFEHEDLQNKIFENGYDASVLSIFAALASTPTGIKTDIPFSDLFETNTNYNVSLNSIESVLGFNLDNFPKLKEKLLDNNGSIDGNKINDVKDYIKVYKYTTSNQWEEVNSNDIDLEIDGVNDNNNIERVYHSNPNDNAAVIVKNLGSATLLVATYKEPVNATPSVTYNTYGLNIKVVDEDNNPLPNALVKMKRGSGGTEILNYTDTNGTAHFDVLAADGAIGTISLNAIEGSHYPVSKVLNISSLTADENTTVTLKMQAPPSYATVKGEVTDSDTNEPVVNSKVNLIYPIALADVKKDVTKVLDNNQTVKGLEVGLIPNARYKWYIKAHDDTNDLSNSNARVSTQRWILVQEATASNGGNFLPYNRIVAQALAAPKSSDPSDVTIIPTGQFDVAVEVDHDIDADGNYDFVELAATNAPQSNLSGEEFSSANNNYGRILGFISTSVDIQKLIEENAGALQPGDNDIYVDLNGSGFEQKGTVSDLGNLSDYTLASDDDAQDTGLTTVYNVGDNVKIDFSNNNRYILISDDTHHTSDHKVINTTWKAGISATLKDTDGNNHYIALKKVGNGYEWVERDNFGINADGSDDDYLTDIKSGEFSGIEYNKIGQFIAQNQIFKKLAQKLSDIKTEVGGDWTPENADNSLVKDGFVLSIVPELDFNITADTTNVPVGTTFKVRKEATIALGGNDNDINKYIKLDEVVANRPVLTESTQTVHTDRVGLYQFSAVPLSYGELNSQESLLRVQAKQLGYYSSPVVNVPKFTQDDATTTNVREDVKRVDLSIAQKPTYNVEVNVTDTEGNPLNNAVVIIDGVKTDNTDLSESNSLEALQGSDVTFNNVIGGRGSKRIIRVSVPDSNYIPVIKTLRNLDSNKVVNVKLVNASDVADFPAQITILNSSVNPRTGIANITLNIVDKDDGTTTVNPENIYVTDNGEVAPAVINETGTNFDVSLPLNVGENRINIEVTNSKGISRSNTVTFNYNPNIGSIAGKIYGITDENNDGLVDLNRVLVLDIFDSNGMYINTAMPSNDGRYIIQDLEAGKTYKIQALELNAQTNRILKKSNLEDVTVVGGQVFSKDLTLQTVQTSTVTGAPVIDFIGDITQAPISENGELNLSFTVSNFDLDNGAKAAIVVNDIPYAIDSAKFNSDGSDNHSYNVQNFPVQLRPGQNIIYLVAQNPDGSFDWSADEAVNWNANSSANIATVDINVMDDNNVSIPASVELRDENGNLINSNNTDNNGQIEFRNVLSGTYHINVAPLMDGYNSVFIDKNITAGSNEINITLPSSLPDFNIPDYYVSSIDLNETTFIKGEPFNATANLVVSDSDFNMSEFTYNWYYSKDNNKTYTDCHTETCDFNLTQTGWYTLGLEVGIGNDKEEYSTDVYVDSVRIDGPPTVNGVEDSNLLPPTP